MLFFITILLWSTAVSFLAVLYQKWISYSSFHTAVQRSCKRPPKYPRRSYLGTDLMKQRIKAVEEGRQSKLFLEHFNIIGETWEENYLGVRVYNSGQVQNIQHVGTTAFNDYRKPAVTFFLSVLGKEIFSLDGAAWRHSRDLIKPIFSRSEVSDIDTLGPHTDRFLNKIQGDGTTIDLQPLLHKFFLDTSTEFIFGQSIDSQLPNDPNNSKELLEAFMGALAGVAKRRIAGGLGAA